MVARVRQMDSKTVVGFTQNSENSLVAAGFIVNRQLKALYSYAEDGDDKCMVCSHVDDLLFCFKDGYEKLIKPVLCKVVVWEINQGPFGF